MQLCNFVCEARVVFFSETNFLLKYCLQNIALHYHKQTIDMIKKPKRVRSSKLYLAVYIRN